MSEKHEKIATWFTFISFVAPLILAGGGIILFPADFSGQFPVYQPNSVMLMVYGNALLVAGLTLTGIKLADEKKVLPAAGFTMLAISTGIFMASIFEISQVVSLETYEKFYRIQASTNFVYLPAMFLIYFYEDFKKWLRISGILTSIPFLTASFLFLSGNRNFDLLENISNVGFVLLMTTEIGWAMNILVNYKKKRHTHTAVK